MIVLRIEVGSNEVDGSSEPNATNATNGAAGTNGSVAATPNAFVIQAEHATMVAPGCGRKPDETQVIVGAEWFDELLAAAEAVDHGYRANYVDDVEFSSRMRRLGAAIEAGNKPYVPVGAVVDEVDEVATSQACACPGPGSKCNGDHQARQLRPELWEAMDATWEENQAAYRHLADRDRAATWPHDPKCPQPAEAFSGVDDFVAITPLDNQPAKPEHVEQFAVDWDAQQRHGILNRLWRAACSVERMIAGGNGTAPFDHAVNRLRDAIEEAEPIAEGPVAVETEADRLIARLRQDNADLREQIRRQAARIAELQDRVAREHQTSFGLVLRLSDLIDAFGEWKAGVKSTAAFDRLVQEIDKARSPRTDVESKLSAITKAKETYDNLFELLADKLPYDIDPKVTQAVYDHADAVKAL